MAEWEEKSIQRFPPREKEEIFWRVLQLTYRQATFAFTWAGSMELHICPLGVRIRQKAWNICCASFHIAGRFRLNSNWPTFQMKIHLLLSALRCFRSHNANELMTANWQTWKNILRPIPKGGDVRQDVVETFTFPSRMKHVKCSDYSVPINLYIIQTML